MNARGRPFSLTQSTHHQSASILASLATTISTRLCAEIVQSAHQEGTNI